MLVLFKVMLSSMSQEKHDKPFFSRVNLKHPNISMNILYTAFYTFPKVLTRRICLKMKSSLLGEHFVFYRDLNV